MKMPNLILKSVDILYISVAPRWADGWTCSESGDINPFSQRPEVPLDQLSLDDTDSVIHQAFYDFVASKW